MPASELAGLQSSKTRVTVKQKETKRVGSMFPSRGSMPLCTSEVTVYIHVCQDSQYNLCSEDFQKRFMEHI